MAVNEINYKDTIITSIRSASCALNESISLSSLPVDTLTAVVADKYGTLASVFATQAYGDVVKYFHSDDLVGKFYLENIERIGKMDWQFNCISDLGLLVSAKPHYGGIYTGQSAQEVISDIIGTIIPYTLDDSLKAVEIYGWLKKASRRDNLRSVLFAIGGTIQRDSEGDLVIAPYGPDPTPIWVSSHGFYKDGGNLKNDVTATRIVLTEHAFAARDSDTVTTLFDGAVNGTDIITPKGASVNGIIVNFDAPMHDLTVSGSTILESDVNYAVLATSGYALLTGKEYTHTQREVPREIVTGITPKSVESSACTLINIRNSPSVLDRLEAFYGHIKRVNIDMVLQNQKPGNYVHFTDPYGNDSTGYIESLEVSMSKEKRASASIVCGFIPPVDVPMYLHYEFISENTTWTVPDGVEEVRMVLIGGGPGGSSGGAGNPGKSSSDTRSGSENRFKAAVRDFSEGGIGGVGGPPAPNGGNVFSTTIPVEPGQKFEIVIGAGGTGGAGNNSSTSPRNGNAGGATTFGEYSSANGSPVPNGYLEEITGQTYAAPGTITGTPGGNGVGADPDGEADYNSFKPIIVPSAVGGYRAGQQQKMTLYKESYTGDWGTPQGNLHQAWYGGLGGGPAMGSNGGSNNQNASAWTESRKGGKGGNATIKPKAPTTRGNGGNGGHGGGGGGGFGGMYASRQTSLTQGGIPSGPATPASNGTPGAGGYGGPGGDGARGICFLYYYSPEKPAEEA